MNRKLIEKWLERAILQEQAAIAWPSNSYSHKQGMQDSARSLAIAEKLERELYASSS